VSLVNNNGGTQNGGFQYGKYSYNHYLVEAKFQGHEESSSAEIIIRKERGHSGYRPRNQYPGDHHGINQAGNF